MGHATNEEFLFNLTEFDDDNSVVWTGNRTGRTVDTTLQREVDSEFIFEQLLMPC